MARVIDEWIDHDEGVRVIQTEDGFRYEPLTGPVAHRKGMKMAKTTKTAHYEVNVIRGGVSIRYNAERYPTRASAIAAAKRLDEYAEIHWVQTTTINNFVDRVEAD